MIGGATICSLSVRGAFIQFLPMALKVYAYKGCGTCRKAAKYLAEKSVEYKEIAIRENPPSKAELKRMLAAVGDLKKLFNTSGQDYRSLGMKDKLPTMTVAQAIDLLSTNGNLIKRPFAIDGEKGVVGFRENEWDELLG